MLLAFLAVSVVVFVVLVVAGFVFMFSFIIVDSSLELCGVRRPQKLIMYLNRVSAISIITEIHVLSIHINNIYMKIKNNRKNIMGAICPHIQIHQFSFLKFQIEEMESFVKIYSELVIFRKKFLTKFFNRFISFHF